MIISFSIIISFLVFSSLFFFSPWRFSLPFSPRIGTKEPNSVRGTWRCAAPGRPRPRAAHGPVVPSRSFPKLVPLEFRGYPGSPHPFISGDPQKAALLLPLYSESEEELLVVFSIFSLKSSPGLVGILPAASCPP